MLRNTMLASAALALAAAPITSQAATATATRNSADVEQADQLHGTTAWILAAIALGLVIWGVIELTDDDPESP
jgi:thiosulfate reductase cytochrome b subunit